MEPGQGISGVFKDTEGTGVPGHYKKQDSLFYVLTGEYGSLTAIDEIGIEKTNGITRVSVSLQPALSRDLVAGKDYKNENGYEVFDRGRPVDSHIGFTWERYRYELFIASDHYLVARKTRWQYNIIFFPPFFVFSKDVIWIRWKPILQKP